MDRHVQDNIQRRNNCTYTGGPGDIIVDDKTKEFRLLGNEIFMHVDEADGGGYCFGKVTNTNGII